MYSFEWLWYFWENPHLTDSEHLCCNGFGYGVIILEHVNCTLLETVSCTHREDKVDCTFYLLVLASVKNNYLAIVL